MGLKWIRDARDGGWHLGVLDRVVAAIFLFLLFQLLPPEGCAKLPAPTDGGFLATVSRLFLDQRAVASRRNRWDDLYTTDEHIFIHTH